MLGSLFDTHANTNTETKQRETMPVRVPPPIDATVDRRTFEEHGHRYRVVGELDQLVREVDQVASISSRLDVVEGADDAIDQAAAREHERDDVVVVAAQQAREQLRHEVV